VKQSLVILGVLLVGLAAGYVVADMAAPDDTRGGTRSSTVAIETLKQERFENRQRIQELLDEIARLKAQLAETAPAAANPYPNDTPEEVEKLMADALAENNIDWLLEVVERLLRLGEPGYPILRRLLEDIIFKRKFLPSESDFRVDHIYRFARIFANLEGQFIGFLNYLLQEPRAHPYFKQAAMMGGAFYVGSKAPGTEELNETMVGLFMEQSGLQVPGMIPGNIGKRMQIMAMAMSGDKEMIEPLRDELNRTKDKELQSDIIGALSYLGDPQTLPLIQERLDPAQGDYRREIEALGRLDTEEAHKTATDFISAIPDSKRFYRHAGRYVRHGGGSAGVMLIRERVQANPSDPEVRNAIGTLRRYPTQESLDTLNLIAASAPDKKVAERATEAATDVDRILRGEMPKPGERIGRRGRGRDRNEEE